MKRAYQLYMESERKNKYLCVKKGKYQFSITKATSFDYETALQLKEKYANKGINFVICDKTHAAYKHLSKEDEWKYSIAVGDKLWYEKEDAIQSAVDLLYSNEILQMILDARTKTEITKALTKGRTQIS